MSLQHAAVRIAMYAIVRNTQNTASIKIHLIPRLYRNFHTKLLSDKRQPSDLHK